MHSIYQILNEKGHAIWSVTPDMMVYDAIRQMAERGVGALLVMKDDRLEGVISERDYARKVILEGRNSRETPVGDIMTRDVVSIGPDLTANQGLALMTNKRIRHLPVIEGGKVTGVVSIGDLVKAVIDDQQHQIEQLERYVTG